MPAAQRHRQPRWTGIGNRASPAPFPFAEGWLPTGVTRTADGAYRLDLHGVRARLVCAAVPRAEVVSGWDLALPADHAADISDAEGAIRRLNTAGTSHASLEGLARFLLRAESVAPSRAPA